MADDIVRWITMNGVHIPIRDGETTDEAIKNKQIALNKEEAEMRNSEKPRRLSLSNITVTAKNTDGKRVLLGVSTDGPKKRLDFVKGSEIRGAYVFAGAGTSKVFRNAEFFADRYKGCGKPSEWQHCAGYALLTNGKKTFVREVHWVQGSDGVIREAFIKVRH